MDITSRTTHPNTPRIALWVAGAGPRRRRVLVSGFVVVALAGALAVAAGVSLPDAAAHPASRPAATRIVGGTDETRAAVTWALERYRTAGLAALPSLEIELHPNDAGCDGNLGYYRDGRVDLCVAEASEPYARKFALHELAHAWTAAHIDEPTRARFLELEGTANWNASGDGWKARGFEQVAEVIAWGLGEGEIQPLLPAPASTDELGEAFVLLTGERPINGLG